MTIKTVPSLFERMTVRGRSPTGFYAKCCLGLWEVERSTKAQAMVEAVVQFLRYEAEGYYADV